MKILLIFLIMIVACPVISEAKDLPFAQKQRTHKVKTQGLHKVKKAIRLSKCKTDKMPKSRKTI